jgi:hypothetical protein
LNISAVHFLECAALGSGLNQKDQVECTQEGAIHLEKVIAMHFHFIFNSDPGTWWLSHLLYKKIRHIRPFVPFVILFIPVS